MKKILINIAVVVFIIAVIAVAIKILYSDNQEIDRLLDQLKSTRVKVDSLQNLNQQLMVQADSLHRQYETRSQEVKELDKRITAQKREYHKTIRSLYVFEGSNDSLLRELNRASHTQFTGSPD